MFTRLLPEERIVMLQTNLLVKTIEVTQPRVLIHQLRQIAHAARGAPDMRPVHPFKQGDYVRIKYGPMHGTEGYVKRDGPHATLCLNVDMLGVAVEVAVSPMDIELARK